MRPGARRLQQEPRVVKIAEWKLIVKATSCSVWPCGDWACDASNCYRSDRQEDRALPEVRDDHGSGGHHAAPDCCSHGTPHVPVRHLQSDQNLYAVGQITVIAVASFRHRNRCARSRSRRARLAPFARGRCPNSAAFIVISRAFCRTFALSEFTYGQEGCG